SLVERFQALETALLAADGLAVLDATLEAFAMAGFASLLQALFVTPVDAFLEALSDSALQCRRIAGQDVVALRHGSDPRRKTERAPGAAFALDDLDSHGRLLDRLFAEQLNLQLAIGGHLADHRHDVLAHLLDPRQRHRTLTAVDRLHLLCLTLGH